MQNLLSSAASVAADGTLYMNLGGAHVGMIDTRDIGEFAARILENPRPHTGKVYTPTGPESSSMAAAADALGRVLGKPVSYVALPQDAARTALTWFVPTVTLAVLFTTHLALLLRDQRLTRSTEATVPADPLVALLEEVRAGRMSAEQAAAAIRGGVG